LGFGIRPVWVAAAVVAATIPLAARPAAVLRSTSAIPPELSGTFRDAAAFAQSASGQYFVFDRRAHAVYGIDPQQTRTWEIVQIGEEPGRIIDPTAFSLEPQGTFVVADAPRQQERIQIFNSTGARIGGFTLPGRLKPLVMIGNAVVSGISSLQYTGRAILMNQPEAGALVAEYLLSGGVNRTFGRLRATGHEDDPDLHLALNTGWPLVDPTGGFYFVFQAGTPVFQKYDRAGRLLWERHIEGREIDDLVAAQPTAWKRTATGERPLVSAIVRAAAVDPGGRLWVSFTVPFTYVFDRDGDKIATLQFRGAGILAPTSLFFSSTTRLLVAPGLYEFSAPR